MSTLKEFITYFLDGLNKTDFVKLLNNIIDFFKKYIVKEDATTAPADTTAKA